MKKRIVAFLLVLCTVFALLPVNVLAATAVNTFTITTSTPVGGQFPPYDASEPDDFSSYVQYVRWTGNFDEVGRCKSGETYKAYITVRIKDGQNKIIEHVAKYVTVNGELATLTSISNDKKEAVITYSFTAAKGSPSNLKLESVSSFKEGDCGYAEVTGNSYSYLRSSPNYSDFNSMTSPTVWKGETLVILYADIVDGFHAVLYNGKCYYYYDPVYTFLTNEQRFGNNKPVPVPKEEAEPAPTVQIIDYTDHVTFSVEYNKAPQYTLPTSDKYTCTAVCEPAKKPYDFSRLYVTFTPNEGYAFAKEGVFKPYSIDVVENVEHLSDGSVRLTYAAFTWAGDAAIGPTDQMIAHHEHYAETYRPDTVAIATIYDPSSRVDRKEVPVYDYPVTGTRSGVTNHSKKSYKTGDKVYIMEFDVEDFFEGTVGEWVRLTDGKYLPAAYLSDIQYTDNWVGTPGKRVDSDFAFAGGSGTKEDPYLIETAEQLNAVRKGLCYHYKLIADIDLSKWATGSP
ncbi:MAG: hypothetical protein IKU55_02005, partial [Clostridia bacterium]|nr:hypothetical protein [Clostridia bacterium]